MDNAGLSRAEGCALGPVNWIAVILAANLATALRIVWYGPLMGRGNLIAGRAGAADTRPRPGWLGIIGLLFVSATMLGHMFARISPGKPWLYFMMAGGIALTFIVPSLWLAYERRAVPGRETLAEAGYWIVAYLGMGAVFWALA